MSYLAFMGLVFLLVHYLNRWLWLLREYMHCPWYGSWNNGCNEGRVWLVRICQHIYALSRSLKKPVILDMAPLLFLESQKLLGWSKLRQLGYLPLGLWLLTLQLVSMCSWNYRTYLNFGALRWLPLSIMRCNSIWVLATRQSFVSVK